MNKKTIKIKSSLLENLVSKVIKEEYKEDRGSRYMFFSNLKQMSRQADILLDMDKTKLENILEDGHDWAQDHIAEAKSLLDQVFDFIKNEVKGSGDVELEESLWKNIHAKRKRGEKPAKPGDDAYPDKKTWDELTKESKSPCWDGYEKVPGKKDFEKGSCRKKKTNEGISESLKYHLENRIPIRENIYRQGSKAYLNLLKEVRGLYFKGKLKLQKLDEEFIMSDVGYKDFYNGEEVWLDTPMVDRNLNEAEYNGRKVDLNSPGKSGGKNFVYVKGCLKDPNKVKKITYGSSMPDRLKDPERRKAYSARHGCEGLTLKDKCTKKYWACRKPRDFADVNAWW